MKNLCFKLTFLILLIIFVSKSENTPVNNIFVDIGLFAGGFQGKEKHECKDIGFVGKENDILCKADVDGQKVVHDKCFPDCVKINKTKTKLQYGSSAGVYFALDQNYAIGIEGFSEWHDVQYKDGNSYLECQEEVCNKKKERIKFDLDEGGNLVAGDPDYDTKCSDLAHSERVYDCMPVVKIAKHHSYGALLAMKFYTADAESFVKLGVGLGQLVMKIPVGVAHDTEEEAENCYTSPHKYAIKKIKCKKGYAWEAAIGTRIATNMFAGITYMGQRNLTDKKDIVYTNHRVGLGLTVDFGR